jgi:hypothetical protein
MNKEEFKKWFSKRENSDYTMEDLNEMSDYELFDAYLKWIGIIGYTDDILETIKSIKNGKEDIL